MTKMTQQTFSIRLANVLYDSDLLNKERLPKEILLGSIESIIEYALSAYMKEQDSLKAVLTNNTITEPL